MASRSRPIKITVVGDDMVGKTCLLTTYVEKKIPTEDSPTVFDNYSGNITVDGEEFNMTLWSTAGQEDYERMRSLSYPHTDCFLLCFSISARSSFENVTSKWYPEIKFHCPNVPIVLVGTKGDLRDQSGTDVITPEECEKMKEQIRASRYVECSAMNQETLQVVFIEAIRAALKKRPGEKSCCTM